MPDEKLAELDDAYTVVVADAARPPGSAQADARSCSPSSSRMEGIDLVIEIRSLSPLRILDHQVFWKRDTFSVNSGIDPKRVRPQRGQRVAIEGGHVRTRLRALFGNVIGFSSGPSDVQGGRANG